MFCAAIAVFVLAASGCAKSEASWQSWVAKDAAGFDGATADERAFCTALLGAYQARLDYRAAASEAGLPTEGGAASAEESRTLTQLLAERTRVLDVVVSEPFVPARSVWALIELESVLNGARYSPMLFIESDVSMLEADRRDVDEFARLACGFPSALIDVASGAEFLAVLTNPALEPA